jgi:hypothetical protein
MRVLKMGGKWHLVVATCCGIPVATALAFGQAAGAGIRQYGLLIPAALLLGLVCAALLNTMRTVAYAHITARPAPSRGWYLRAFYVAVLAWMVAAGVFGIVVASVITRFV